MRRTTAHFLYGESSMTENRREPNPKVDRHSHTAADPIFLTEKQLASRWNISVKAVQRWRVVGQGPKWMKFGAAVRYPPAVVEEMEAASLRSSTSEKRGMTWSANPNSLLANLRACRSSRSL